MVSDSNVSLQLRKLDLAKASISHSPQTEELLTMGGDGDRVDDIKRHAMYEGLDWNRLERKSISAPWVPERLAKKCESQDIPVADDVYTGDQVEVKVSLTLFHGRDL